MKLLNLFILSILLISCSMQQEPRKASSSKKTQVDSTSTTVVEDRNDPSIDSALLLTDLINVQSLNPSIFVDLKYATTDNFMKMKLYERLKSAYLQKDVAARLSKCQDYLTSIDSTLHLLIYDAVRPVSIQAKMWRALDSIPSKERGKYVSNPANKSLHNFGAAVDLTICDSNGKALDMGADFDEFNEIAYPTMEAHFLANGKLTQQQIDNRQLLRKVMKSQGFRNLPTEWWHFNACSRNDALMKYKILDKEP
ncbi:MAG: peptidase M15 [Crocinitomicaceae bacterium]|nr:MAG: peptidase M15 [Crocinitomicaceae bacterium]